MFTWQTETEQRWRPWGLPVEGVACPRSFRRALPDDVDGVVDCQTTSWREAYAGLVSDEYLYDPSVVARRRQRWLERLRGGRLAYLAELDGETVGVASAGPSRDEYPVVPTELMSLYVRSARQGAGIGGGLLTAAVGSDPASLWVFEANARAQRFYRRYGFEADGHTMADADTGLTEIRMLRR